MVNDTCITKLAYQLPHLVEAIDAQLALPLQSRHQSIVISYFVIKACVVGLCLNARHRARDQEAALVVVRAPNLAPQVGVHALASAQVKHVGDTTDKLAE